MKLPPVEDWYVWREYTYDGGKVKRLLVPRSNPYEYEDSFDFMFKSPEEAMQGLKDFSVSPAESKNWVLCKMTYMSMDKEGVTND